MAAVRIPFPLEFPYTFRLTAEDVTPEGAEQPMEWAAKDLLISSRLDLDGTSQTRDPGDLVGQGVLQKAGGNVAVAWQGAVVVLQGRGFGGKMITAKQN